MLEDMAFIRGIQNDDRKGKDSGAKEIHDGNEVASVRIIRWGCSTYQDSYLLLACDSLSINFLYYHFHKTCEKLDWS